MSASSITSVRLSIALVLLAHAGCQSATETLSFGDCADAGSAVEFEMLFAGDVYLPVLTNSGAVIENQAQLDALLSGVNEGDGLPGASAWNINFGTHLVLAASAFSPNTCEMTLDSYDVRNLGETVRLTVRSTDHTAQCEAVCDALGQSLVIVAIARTNLEATTCVTRTDTCNTGD
ncbi:MAG: hypothetical protein H0T42_15525 [Deltaproteobacteria bacterium]|nr:hypothetical protein [Deltaproteobacteria bacterium]